MTNFSEFGFGKSRHPVLSVQYFALEHLVSVQATTSDLRWAMLELALRSFTAIWVLAQGQVAGLACRIRHGRRCLERRLDAADTMVAAGGR